jgi:hypothetical protein
MKKKPGIYGPDDPEVQDIMNVLRSAYEVQAAVSGRVEPQANANTVEAIAWNAVVMAHPNRFPDMPETTSFANLVVQQLSAGNFLRAGARPHAPCMVAGLLRFLWDSQNLMYLDPQVARGQAGTFQQMIEDVNRNWTSADKQIWFSHVSGFPAKVDQALAYIHAQTWENVYKVLDPTMAELEAEALQILDNVDAAYPDALPGVAAYVSGTVIVKNTFSPLDGSVPESVGERLTKVYHALDSNNESRFFPYLTRGFQAVREEQESDLSRWRREDL